MRGDYSFLLSVRGCLDRHCRGDWGDVGDESRRMNNDALEDERNGRFSDSLLPLHQRRQGDLHHHGMGQVCDDELFPDEY